MQYNLGWCTGRVAITYGTAPRKVQVRIKQMGTNTERSFTLTQNNGTGQATGGNNPYWQWGRKDPIPASTGVTGSTADKTIYGNYSYTIAPMQGTIGSSVQNPHTFYPYNGNWTSSGDYNNLWSADNTVTIVNDNTVVKTVYDPSPAGFSLPASASWTGFTTTGSNSTTPSEFRVDGSFNAGRNFYTIYNSTASYVFYPASGYRASTSGVPTLVGFYGHYWSETAYSITSARYMAFAIGTVYPQDYNTKAIGFAVRCVHQ